MRNFLFFFILLSTTFSNVYSQSKHFKFEVKDREAIREITKIISIDNYKNGVVWAYATDSEFAEFLKLGYSYKELPLYEAASKTFSMATTVQEMSDWTKYPTYEVYEQMMNKYAQDYPAICQLLRIGTSKNGKTLYALKISDNVTVEEDEPNFLYTSTMHGDETTGYLLMLKYIDFLLSNYGKDKVITDYVNNIEIFINPLSNPDGTYAGGNNTVMGAVRNLSDGTDPNRDFPDPISGTKNSYSPETQAMMSFASNYHFVLSANFHGGDEVVNYPWDTWHESHAHPDTAWYKKISLDYVKSIRKTSPSYFSSVSPSGVTVGSSWYFIEGGRQDYMNFYQNCREVTIELSSTKTIQPEQLEEYWQYNKDALLNYMAESLYGIRGIVCNSAGKPLNATITVQGHDTDNSYVKTDPTNGNYHRLIQAGTYNLVFSSQGFDDITINNVSVSDKKTTIVDVVFGGTLSDVNIQGTITDKSKTGIEGVSITINNTNNNYSTVTDSQGNYSFIGIKAGTYNSAISKDGFMTLSSTDSYKTSSTKNFELVKFYNISGKIFAAQTGDIIENAQIEIVNSTNKVNSNNSGEYSLSNITEGSYILTVSKVGFSDSEQTITITDNITNNNFLMLTSKSESFESNIPAEYTFSGNKDWAVNTTSAFSGTNSMKSGAITHKESSSMILTQTVEAGKISFYKKVSSEPTFDFLNFYIDDQIKGAWSGNVDWSKESYSISPGNHIFKWEYIKDNYTSEGSDCAWVDLVELPIAVPTKYNLTFIITNNKVPVENAKISIPAYGEQVTDAKGTAVFSGLYKTTGEGLIYSITTANFEPYSRRISLNSDLTKEIDLSNVSVSNLSSIRVEVYPNPGKSNFTVESTLKINKIEIYNLTGELQNTIHDNNHFIIEKQGLFLVKIFSDNEIFTRKLLVE